MSAICPVPATSRDAGFRQALDRALVTELVRQHLLESEQFEPVDLQPDYVRWKESDGSIVGPGDRVDLPAGSSHFFDVLPGEELIFAVVVEGVSFGDDVQAP